MCRAALPAAVLAVLLAAPALRGDAFDNYTNPLLAKVPAAKGVLKLKRVTPAQLSEHAGVLAGTTGAFLVVRTNEGRLARLLVQAARQKLPAADGSVPVLLVERFVTFREGEERAVQAQGQGLRLFDDFLLSLDLGQVVPAKVGGDLRFVAGPEKTYLEPVGKAELYLLTQALPEATPKKPAKLVVGAAFEARYFNGTYKLYDDGRRSGTLHLKLAANGDVTGHYFSDKDGKKYDVEGKVGTPPHRYFADKDGTKDDVDSKAATLPHAIQFRIIFPRTVQEFQGWLFTGDGRALVGSSRLQNRETGFYALRVEE
jgi:hypothetical protein